MVVFLAKVFREAKHAEDFLNGKMHSNSLAYFKRIEDGGVRGDEDEGAIMLQREGLITELTATNRATGEVDTIRISGHELASPLVMHPERLDHINVFCMYAGHTGDLKSISEQSVLEFKKQLAIPDDCAQLGKYAVVVTNVREFLGRVKAGAKRKRYGVCGGLVRYYDAQVGSPPTKSEIGTIFTKRKEYEYQKEFRIAIDTGAKDGNSVTLCIGKIHDIAMPISTSDINRQLRVRIDPQAHTESSIILS